jgi:hypothetical protein
VLARRYRSSRTPLDGANGGLDAVAHVELGEDARDVVLDRRRAEIQHSGDLGIVPSAGQQGQDLALARSYVRADPRRIPGEQADFPAQAASDDRRENDSSRTAAATARPRSSSAASRPAQPRCAESDVGERGPMIESA